VRGDTVRVYGRLRQFDGTKTINIYKMLPVTDPKEVELQALEVKIAEAYWMKVGIFELLAHIFSRVGRELQIRSQRINCRKFSKRLCLAR
jgi:hypothetical protein